VTASPARLAAGVMLGLLAGACSTAAPGGSGGGGHGGSGSGSAGSSSAAGSSASGSGNAGSGSGGSSAGSNGSAGSGGSGGSGLTTGAGGSGHEDGGGQGGSASQSDGGGPAQDAMGDSGGVVAPGTAPLTQFLRIIQVTTVQGATTVSISIDGQKQHNGAIHAGQALMMRIHVRPDTGWVAHPTVAELHLINAAADVILTSAPRTITGASSAGVLDSTFNFDLTVAQVTKDLRFSVALRDPTGTPPDAPPAIQRALYPRDGTLDTLDAM
jgi:hypothetical protein